MCNFQVVRSTIFTLDLHPRYNALIPEVQANPKSVYAYQVSENSGLGLWHLRSIIIIIV